MKTIPLLTVIICAILLQGCATFKKLLPAQYDGKEITRYETLADVNEAEFIPVPIYDVQEYPPAEFITKDGKEYAAFDKDGILKLMEFRSQHKHNTAQLREANEVILLQVKERNEIYHIALDMQNKANLEIEKTELRDKELSAERRKNFFQRWTERGIFAVLIYLVAG